MMAPRFIFAAFSVALGLCFCGRHDRQTHAEYTGQHADYAGRLI